MPVSEKMFSAIGLIAAFSVVIGVIVFVPSASLHGAHQNSVMKAASR